jgi:rSAM/selenodomain-associated transferase 2
MISVIIPTCNDENLIKTTIFHLKENAYCRLLKEIIVVDAGSTDKTVREAQDAGATVVRSLRRERASQFNLGAQHASGKILYFLLPGTLPPKHFTNEIVRAAQKGFSFGAFTMKFEYKHWLLKTLSWFTKREINYTRVDGQSLFVVQELFEKVGKFREDLMILEDHEFICRLKRYSNFVIFKDHIVASTKKYLRHGVLRTELTYLIVWLMYGLGCQQQKLMKVYKGLLGQKTVVPQTTEALSPSMS